MEKITAADAKQNFGKLLDKVQRESVTITKHGRPVAVLLSVYDFEQIQIRKRRLLHHRLQLAEQEVEAGLFVDGAKFFDHLLEKHVPNKELKGAKTDEFAETAETFKTKSIASES